MLERVQRRATKFILSDYNSDYKSRLCSLNLLPLMMHYEILDIAFFLNSMTSTSTPFDILNYVSFITGSSRAANLNKLKHCSSNTKAIGHSYFHRLPRLWNALPAIVQHQSVPSILAKLKKFFWAHFLDNFLNENVCSYHFLCPCHKCSNTPTPVNYSLLS